MRPKLDQKKFEAPPTWAEQKGIARSVLNDRFMRRKFVSGLLAFTLVLIFLGLWGVENWLEVSPLRFLCWWAGVGALSCFVLLFGLYDALRSVKEEQKKSEEVEPLDLGSKSEN